MQPTPAEATDAVSTSWSIAENGRAAQKLAGHKTSAMTDHYTDLDAEDFREELEQI